MKLLKKLLMIIIVLVLLVISLFMYGGYSMYKDATSGISLEDKVNSIMQNKDYIKYNELPTDYVNAVISVEDHRFYGHKGIDILSITRALVNNIKAGEIVEGGSTITQQLAKNIYFTQEQEIERKIAELFVVYELEKNYTKEEILALYVNTSYFGDGYYGIGQAAEGYLNKEPKDMTLSECTLLAGIPNAPSVYAPTQNPDLAIQRQKRVIYKMVENGELEQSEADEIIQELE